MASALATSAPLRMPPEIDQLHRAAHVQIVQRVDGLAQRRQRRNADVLDEHRLRRGRAALHAVDHDHIRAGVHGELDVVERARRADLHVDRLLPVGDFAQLLDLDDQVVGAGPVGMARGRALIDAFRQGAHAAPRAD